MGSFGPARALLGSLVAIVAACGPTVPGPSLSTSGASGTSRSTEAAGSGPASSSATTATTVATTTTSTLDETTGRATADASTDTSPNPLPPGSDCVSPAPPRVDPPVPANCEPVWLVDAEGSAIQGSPSGLVRCFDAEMQETIVFRTAAVACPELIGGECLCDADCGQGEACICANEATYAPGIGWPASNRCFPADCAGEGDCDGEACRFDIDECRFLTALRCTTAADDCEFHSECDGRFLGFCDYDESMEFFTCEPGSVCE